MLRSGNSYGIIIIIIIDILFLGESRRWLLIRNILCTCKRLLQICYENILQGFLLFIDIIVIIIIVIFHIKNSIFRKELLLLFIWIKIINIINIVYLMWVHEILRRDFLSSHFIWGVTLSHPLLIVPFNNLLKVLIWEIFLKCPTNIEIFNRN